MFPQTSGNFSARFVIVVLALVGFAGLATSLSHSRSESAKAGSLRGATSSKQTNLKNKLTPLAGILPDPSTDLTWLNVAVSGPSARVGHQMVYDSARNKVILFGGQTTQGSLLGGQDLTGQLLNDVWEWDGTTATWTEITPASGPIPPARSFFGMAYDAARSKVVVYGGKVDAIYYSTSDDTWEWDPATSTWASFPSAGSITYGGLRGLQMAYDPNLSEVILFGGIMYTGTHNGQTWAWNGNTWTLKSSSGPEARVGHAMSTDLARSRVVLFGGYDYTANSYAGAFYPETWEWDGTAWTQVAASGPAPRIGGAMAYDTIRGVSVLFGGTQGGYADAPPVYNDTWEWDGTSWSLRSMQTSPLPRDTVLAFDGTTILLFGGRDSSATLGDTWIIAAATPIPSPTPTPQADLSISKTASPNGNVATSSQITYTVTVNNGGPDQADTVSVSDAIPSGTTFSSFTTSQGSCTAPSVGSTSPPLVCSLGTINSGNSATITLTVDVTALPGATITNTATVSSATSDANTSNNTASASNSVSGCDLVVTNTNDSGAHSLRLAIQCANANPGLETITFNIPGAGVHTIQPLSILPAITDPAIIDGYSQPGSSPNTLAIGDNAVLQIEINGSLAGHFNGLTINVGGAGSTLKGLVINRVGDAGIRLNGGGNRIEGNFIGTNASGTAALGNGSHGVDLNSSSNVIGGTASASRNIISGNNSTGVSLSFNGNVVQNNTVQGNYIGTNAAGTAAVPNNNHGVSIGGSSTSGNLIGGTSAGAGNVISGNATEGLQITGSGGGGGPSGNLVQGNLIGTDVSGTAAIPNGFRGIFVGNGASLNTIGGTGAGARNVISGNNNLGIFITLAGSNIVQGNYIGTDASGTAALGNKSAGVSISSGANNTIGGTAAGAGNVISGNSIGGIIISGATSSGTLVQGNFIGTDVTGTVRVANLGSSGVSINAGANNSLIGGTAAGARNIISGNSSFGVILSSGANLNQVQGNYIGTDVTGTFAITNNVSGVFIQGPSGPLTTNNLIGGAAAGAGNLISGNTLRGVEINGLSAKANEITGNRIGTNASGTGALANNSDGISIQQGAANNTITGNLVSGNRTLGINLGLNTTATTIQGNLIGTDITGSVAVPNSGGISLSGGTNNNQVGGTTPSAGNVISGNTGNGVQLSGSTVTANLIEGNFIGTDISGTAALGNRLAGVVVISSTNTTIGGVSSASRNVISGNGIGTTNPINGSGVVLQTGSNNRVLGNYIGTDVTGNIGLGNTGNGVFVESSINNLVSGNVVSANGQISLSAGIILSTNANSNQVKGNYIGTNAAGTAPLGNGGNGVLVGRTATSASNNLVGGTASGDANVIAFNGSNGILVINNNSLNNALRQNSIFSNSALGIDLGTADGVTPNDSCDADSGANNLQNFPVLTSVSTSGGSTTIQGTLNSTPNTTFTLEFFANSVADPSGNGEGQTFIGSTTVTTDAGCNAAFTFVTAAAPAGQDFFTATATDPAGNTSEFSASKSFDADLSITKTDSPDPVVVGATLTYSITVNNGGPSTATNVSVVDTLPASVTFNSVTSSQGSCTQSAGTVNCNLGTIANGGSATVTITVTPNAAGSITNTAAVSANESDSNSANNTASATTTVIQANTSTTVTSSQNPSIYGEPVTFTATVSAVAPGSGTPTGTVTFYDGATLLGTSNLDSSGQATFTTSALFIGTHSITATYNGDANYNGSTSPPLIQTVVAPPSTDDVKVTGGGSFILTTGGSGTFGLVGKVSSAGAPSGNVEFQDHGTGMNAKAKTITSVVVTGTHAQIFGKATINGTGSYDFVVDVDDLGEPGVNDKFRIQLSNGYVAGPATLSGGNIQVHK